MRAYTLGHFWPIMTQGRPSSKMAGSRPIPEIEAFWPLQKLATTGRSL